MQKDYGFEETKKKILEEWETAVIWTKVLPTKMPDFNAK